MTSSLVGSEMCIRDSPRKRKRKKDKGGTYKGSSSGLPGVLCQADCCLLYTSDAADECSV
eukprot:12866632-Prorocentrum_lima.AAC.1